MKFHKDSLNLGNWLSGVPGPRDEDVFQTPCWLFLNSCGQQGKHQMSSGHFGDREYFGVFQLGAISR